MATRFRSNPLKRGANSRKIVAPVWRNTISKHGAIPSDPKLNEKLNLSTNERVHFFCAYSGEWAHTIAEQGAIVDVSDIAPEQLTKYDTFNRVSGLPAEMHNVMPEYYDWSISFEPIPLFFGGQEKALDTLRIGLLNKKGIKIIFRKDYWYDGYIWALNQICEKYGLTLKTEEIEINDNQENKYFIFTIKTNPKARRLAEIDIFVERMAFRLKDKDPEQAIKYMARILGITEQEVLESLERITI
jgi:hypothetical protein